MGKTKIDCIFFRNIPDLGTRKAMHEKGIIINPDCKALRELECEHCKFYKSKDKFNLDGTKKIHK